MKSILFGLMLSAVLLYSHAEEEAKPKEGEIKIYKRLIPADVLRGKSISVIGVGLGSRVRSDGKRARSRSAMHS